MGGRLIAIGDVHGCYAELSRLLDYLSPTEDDEIVFVGDLVNRGPDSGRVLALARQHATVSLLGNHEWRLLTSRRMKDPSILKDYDHPTIEQMEDEDWDYLARMRLTYYSYLYDTIFVHGGFLPGHDWRNQTVSIVTRIQVVSPDGFAAKRSEFPDAPHWCQLWKGPPFVVYGHTPRLHVLKNEWTLGLDTGCAHGGKLSAWILPDKQIVQVPARRPYWPRPPFA